MARESGIPDCGKALKDLMRHSCVFHKRICLLFYYEAEIPSGLPESISANNTNSLRNHHIPELAQGLLIFSFNVVMV